MGYRARTCVNDFGDHYVAICTKPIYIRWAKQDLNLHYPAFNGTLYHWSYLSIVVVPLGFEPRTPWLKARYIFQLSYETILSAIIYIRRSG